MSKIRILTLMSKYICSHCSVLTTTATHKSSSLLYMCSNEYSSSGIFWVVSISIIKSGAFSGDFNFLSWMDRLKAWSYKVVFNFQVHWTIVFHIKETFKNRKEKEEMWLQVKQIKAVISLMFISWPSLAFGQLSLLCRIVSGNKKSITYITCLF